MSDENSLKNPYWKNADPRNTPELFEVVVYNFVKGVSVSDVAGNLPMSRPAISNMYKHIGERLTFWMNHRLMGFYRECQGPTCDDESLSEPDDHFWAFCYDYRNAQIKHIVHQKSLEGRCEVCVAYQRLPEFQWMFARYRERRGLKPDDIWPLVSLGFARRQAYDLINAFDVDYDTFERCGMKFAIERGSDGRVAFDSASVSGYVTATLLYHFRTYPNGTTVGQTLGPAAFGQWTSYADELASIFRLIDEPEIREWRIRYHQERYRRLDYSQPPKRDLSGRMEILYQTTLNPAFKDVRAFDHCDDAVLVVALETVLTKHLATWADLPDVRYLSSYLRDLKGKVLGDPDWTLPDDQARDYIAEQHSKDYARELEARWPFLGEII